MDSIVPAKRSVSRVRTILYFEGLAEIDEGSEQCRNKVGPDTELSRISLAMLEFVTSPNYLERPMNNCYRQAKGHDYSLQL